jgi:hypothetical protein
MLVTSNLLFLKQMEKAPAQTGAFAFGGPMEGQSAAQPIILQYFSRNPFRWNILQTPMLRKPLNTNNLRPEYPPGGPPFDPIAAFQNKRQIEQ